MRVEAFAMCVMSTKAKMYKAAFAIIALAIFVPTVTSARMSSENYLITADSIDAGGNRSSSTNYVLHDAFGEAVVGSGTSANFQEREFILSYLFRVLGITAPSTTSLVGKTVSASAQTSTGTISGVEVVDDGTAGWSATMTSTHFTTRAAHKNLVDADTDGITGFTGTYDGLDGVLDPPGTFIVEITTGGAVGTAVFKWTDPAGNETTTVTTASTNLLSNGITVDWDDAATYDVGDKFSAAVDVFLYTGLTVTPGTITVVSGDTGGVIAGSAETLSGTGATSNAKTLMTGTSNNSTGTYRQDEALELNIHANPLSGSFTATATLTVL